MPWTRFGPVLVANLAFAAAPFPELISRSALPTAVRVGDVINVTARLRISTAPAVSGGIDISFPSLNVAGVSAGSYNSSIASVSLSKVTSGAAQTWTQRGQSFAACARTPCAAADHLTVSAEWNGPLVVGSLYDLNLVVIPNTVNSTFKIRIRAWAAAAGQPAVYEPVPPGSTTRPLDQQGWPTYEITIPVELPLATLPVEVRNAAGTSNPSVPAAGKAQVCPNGQSGNCPAITSSKVATLTLPVGSGHYYDVYNQGAFGYPESWGRRSNVTVVAGTNPTSVFTRIMPWAGGGRFWANGSDITGGTVPANQLIEFAIPVTVPSGAPSNRQTSVALRLDRGRDGSADGSDINCQSKTITPGTSSEPFRCQVTGLATGDYNFGVIVRHGTEVTDTQTWQPAFTIGANTVALNVKVTNATANTSIPADGKGEVCLQSGSTTKVCQPTGPNQQASFPSVDPAKGPYYVDVYVQGAGAKEYWGRENIANLSSGFHEFRRRHSYATDRSWTNVSLGQAFDGGSSTTTVGGGQALRTTFRVVMPTTGVAGNAGMTMTLHDGTKATVVNCTSKAIVAGGTADLSCDLGAPPSGTYKYGYTVTLDGQVTDTGALEPAFTVGSRPYGTTVINHGFTKPSNVLDYTTYLKVAWQADWMIRMGCAILQHRAAGVGRVLKYDKSTGTFGPDPRITCPSSTSGGETILLFDWSPDSSHPSNGYSEAAGDALYTALLHGRQQGHFTLDRVHFIGHSRGTVANSEAVERLLVAKQKGLAPGAPIGDIDVTNLDAHDWGWGSIVADDKDVNAPDYWTNGQQGGVVTWAGTRWADSYFQRVSPSIEIFHLLGRSVRGSYAQELGVVDLADSGCSANNPEPCHNAVVAWYEKTITDLNSRTGYAFARLGGRFSQREQSNAGTSLPTLIEPYGQGFFNGSFSNNTNALFPDHVPGWHFHGGGGSSYLVLGSLTIAKDRPSATHNYFWLPSGATSIAFDARASGVAGSTQRIFRPVFVNDSDVELAADLNCDGRLSNYIAFSEGFTKTCTISTTNLTGRRRVRFKFESTIALDVASVYLDNIRFLNTAGPVISNVKVTPAESSAVITWTTDKPATSQVEYGATPSYGSSTPVTTALVTSHSVPLSSLTPSTDYNFRVVSRDSAGSPGTSANLTFKTLSTTTQLTITNVAVSAIAASTATITWTTNLGSDSQVEYGTTSTYSASTSIDPALVTSHSQTLTALQPNTTYHYRVKSKASGGTVIASPDATFTTASLNTPTITGVSVSASTATSANIVWTTNVPADSQVEYGTSASYGSLTALSTTLTTSHLRSLSNLTPSTQYFYRVRSRRQTGELGMSGQLTFTTKPADTTPPAISAFQLGVVTSASASLSWTTSEPAFCRIDYGLTTFTSSTPENPTASTTHSQQINGLGANTNYQARISCRDSAGNVATSATVSFRTSVGVIDVTPPVITAVAVSNITTSSATISWMTSEPADGQVEYGTSAALGTTSPLNSTAATSHSHNLTGLAPGTVYQYRVRSKDVAGNPAASPIAAFTTASQPVTALAISGLTSTNISTSTATIVWTTSKPATSQVEYGLTAAYGSSTDLSNTLVASHSQVLSGLTPGKVYFYRVKSIDASGASAVSAGAQFSTAAIDSTAPIISAVAVSRVTPTSAVISWTTNESSDSRVTYGLTSVASSSTPMNPALLTTHNETLIGLEPSTLYYFRVHSADAAGNSASSGFVTFSTPTAGSGANPVISNVAVTNISNNSATIRWTTDVPSSTQVSYGASTTLSPTPLLPGLVTVHLQTLAGLTSGTTYFFQVRSADAANNWASSAILTFTTTGSPDVLPPVLLNVRAVNVSSTSASVVWTTSEPANAIVDFGPAPETVFGTTQSYTSSVGSTTTFAESHNHALINLAPGTTYRYRVTSKDVAGNAGVHAGSFTTLSGGVDVIPPVIVSPSVTALSASGATIKWFTNEPADTQIEYGIASPIESQTALNTSLSTSHSVSLTGLAAGVEYRYRLRSRDAAGNLAVSAEQRLTTIAPGCNYSLPASGVSVPGNGASLTFSMAASLPSCTWMAASNAPWAQVFPISGTGSRNFNLVVFPNFSSRTRTVTISVAGQNFTLTQAANLGTREQRFVELLYFNFMGRLPSDAEREFQVREGLRPPMNWATLTHTFLTSPEFSFGGRFISGLYVGLLDRDAEYGGWLFQKNALSTKAVTHESLVANFVNSAEYRMKFGTPDNAELVRLLYRKVLRREPSQTEVDFQVAQILKTSRNVVATNFLAVPEFQQRAGSRLTSFLLYSTLFLRDASVPEMDRMMKRLDSGEPVQTVIADLVATSEFASVLE